MHNNLSKKKNGFFEKIKLGDHICSIYNNKKQQFSVIVPFFKAGLSNNEKCIYTTEENSKEEVLLEFKKNRIDVDKYIKLNQLVILTKDETYLKNRSFDASWMIEFLKKTEQEVIKEGYNGIRISGEATCVCENSKDNSKFMEYESQVNSIFPRIKVAAVCQYNENILKPEILAEAIHTHPYLVIYGNHHENMYYSPAESIDKAHKLPSAYYEIIRDSIIKED